MSGIVCAEFVFFLWIQCINHFRSGAENDSPLNVETEGFAGAIFGLKFRNLSKIR